MRSLPVYAETDVNLAHDGGVAAWLFDSPHWGVCGQGRSEDEALNALSAILEPGPPMVRFDVVERIHGDELAFQADMTPATPARRRATTDILTRARADTLTLLADCDDELLDFDDPDRTLPRWARWRTLRQMAWHLADTESRYYLPCIGIAARPPEPDLFDELRRSGAAVTDLVATIEPDRVVRHANGEVWTTTKVLRRLAWHERSEFITMAELASLARRRLDRQAAIRPRQTDTSGQGPRD